MSKVQLQGNVSGTGIFTIASPNSNTDRTLTLPDNTGTVLTNASNLAGLTGVGKILQVVNSQSNSYARVQTTSASYVASGYGVTITPSSTSSKILLLFTVGMTYASTASSGVILAIARNTTVLNNGDSSNYGGWFIQNSSVNTYMGIHMTWVDSPSTTSAVTYNLYGRSQNSGTTVFLLHEGSSYSLTALEIAP